MVQCVYMDTPTYVIIFSFVILIILIAIMRIMKVSRIKSHIILFVAISIIWVLLTIFGEFVFGWAGNTACSKYLGCTTGFLGYDAFEHFFFGVLGACTIMWISEHFPTYSIVHSKKWKTILVVVATIALISVLWEILECTHDYFRINILHEHLLSFRFHVDRLDQPSNLDTMGDLTFSLVGSIIGFLLL